jgi:hypothetical protein
LEERLVCNQKAGGSNPPASTLPLIVIVVFALPRSLRTLFSAALALASTTLREFTINFGLVCFRREPITKMKLIKN